MRTGLVHQSRRDWGAPWAEGKGLSRGAKERRAQTTARQNASPRSPAVFAPPSGTVPVREKEALNVPAPMISVPTRSQSGSRSLLRIQVWRSGKNGVPGATIGLGADNQRKSPVVS